MGIHGSKRMRSILLVITCILLTSCEWDAKRDNIDLARENDELRLQLHLSTAYIEDVTQIIDQVQRNLQQIEDREGIIGRISLKSEGAETRAVNVRNQLVTSISDIDAFILDNRKMIGLLEQRIQESQVRIGSLEQLAANLTMAVSDKEKDVVRLKKQVKQLESDLNVLQDQLIAKDNEIKNREETIAAQAEAIVDRETTIREQELAAATAYFVVDTKNGLKNRGLIIEKRSGFLGLGRDLTVGNIAESQFHPVMKSESNLSFGPGITGIEIVSSHKDRPDLFRIVQSDVGASLNITDADGFWALSEYLIVVSSY
jgi:hypothetical protein